MAYGDVFTDTYFLLFVLLVFLAYGGAMLFLMFFIQYEAYRHYKDEWTQRAADHRFPTLERRLSFSEWSLTHNVFDNPDYIFLWSIATRAFSSIHAIVMVTGVTSMIHKFGFTALWDYNFYFYHPRGLVLVRNLNAFMLAYLTIDFVFLVWHRIKLSTDAKPDENFNAAVIHHGVGAISMLQFIKMGIMPFNCLYFAFTEISTITLNIAWLALKLGWDKNPDSKIVYQISAGLTWFLFLTVRIMGSIVLWIYIYTNLHLISSLSIINWVFAFVANPAIIGLNYYWFYKLTRKAIEIVSKKDESKSKAE